MKKEYDLVVVGGGPGGSMAAMHAAKNGISACILEKTRDIGYPVRCGEAMGEMAIGQFFEPKETWIAARIKRCSIIAPNGTRLKIPFNKEQGYVLNRKIFDYDLSLMAASEGAEVYTKSYVTSIDKKENSYDIHFDYLGTPKKINAKIVVGADGVESRVGRWAGLRTQVKMKDMESCMQYSVGNIDIDNNGMDMYVGHNYAPGGYLWVFPKGDGYANIGIGISGKYSKEKSAKKFLDEFIEKNYPTATIHTTMCGGVPCAKPMEHPISDHLMLVGDAAHFVNPLTGGGIAGAMKSGMFAGQVASEAIKADNTTEKFLEKYITLCNKDFVKRHNKIYRVKETIQKLTDEEMNHIADKVIKIPEDKITLGKVFATAVLKKPSMIIDVMRMFAGF
jgi:digeranylgeranylglycerophospholipid reductase